MSVCSESIPCLRIPLEGTLFAVACRWIRLMVRSYST
jgi:hypothetical protein